MKDSCHLCGRQNLQPLIDFGEHPIAHRLLTDPSQKEYVHPVIVCFCQSCGLMQLSDPISSDELYTEYNWLSSWKWNPHVPRLISLIEQLPGLTKRSKIVEIGSNDGSFLNLLRERGYQNVLGVEPAWDAQESARQKGVETIGAYFTPEIAQKIVAKYGKSDLFIARQMLEHVKELEEFQKAMCALLRPEGFVLIEVPDADFILDTFDYSSIWEEHLNYFTLGTLSRFLSDTGIEVIFSETEIFSGQALIIVGKQGQTSSGQSCEYLKELEAKVFAYQYRWPKFRETFARYLQEHQESGGMIAVYGAGCRASSLVNFTGISRYIEFFADDQPEKQGKYMPGSHLPILPGKTLIDHSIDLCLLAVNAENEEKVIANHQTYQQKGGRFVSLFPPSDRLPRFWSNI